MRSNLPEGCLSGRPFRRVAPFTSLGEILEVGDVVQDSTSDFAEAGSTTTAPFFREETSADTQVGRRFRFDQQPVSYVRGGLVSRNGDVLLHRGVPPSQSH